MNPLKLSTINLYYQQPMRLTQWPYQTFVILLVLFQVVALKSAQAISKQAINIAYLTQEQRAT